MPCCCGVGNYKPSLAAEVTIPNSYLLLVEGASNKSLIIGAERAAFRFWKGLNGRLSAKNLGPRSLCARASQKSSSLRYLPYCQELKRAGATQRLNISSSTHSLLEYSERAAVNHMSGKLSPEIPTLQFRITITLHCCWYRIFLFRARLPIDGSLATRDSADRQRKTVR